MSPNPDSILDSVKKTLGLDSSDTSFDLDVTMFINGAFGSLHQVGVGSDTGFIISDNSTLWSQYVADFTYLALVKLYIYMAVRLAFDPPATSFGIDAVKNQIDQLIWRINVAVEQVKPPSDPFGNDESDPMALYFAPKVVQLQFESVITPDASNGNMFYLTLTGDCTINPPVNGADGQHITLEIASNGHSVTWGSGWDFGTSGAPTLSSSGLSDVISAYYKTTATAWRAGFTSGF